MKHNGNLIENKGVKMKYIDTITTQLADSSIIAFIHPHNIDNLILNTALNLVPVIYVGQHKL